MPVLTVREAAKRLNCHTWVIRVWVTKGFLSPVQAPHHRLVIDEADIARVAARLARVYAKRPAWPVQIVE